MKTCDKYPDVWSLVGKNFLKKPKEGSKTLNVTSVICFCNTSFYFLVKIKYT